MAAPEAIRVRRASNSVEVEVDEVMIVLGADTHKRSHTIAAVAVSTGELLGRRTVQSGTKGSAALLRWAHELGAERVWAVEDCRHVSGSFERFLIERMLRVQHVDVGVAAASSRAREVPQHRRARGRPSRAARRARYVASGALGWSRARLAAAR